MDQGFCSFMGFERREEMSLKMMKSITIGKFRLGSG